MLLEGYVLVRARRGRRTHAILDGDEGPRALCGRLRDWAPIHPVEGELPECHYCRRRLRCP